jgi:hypothetical protein
MEFGIGLPKHQVIRGVLFINRCCLTVADERTTHLLSDWTVKGANLASSGSVATARRARLQLGPRCGVQPGNWNAERKDLRVLRRKNRTGVRNGPHLRVAQLPFVGDNSLGPKSHERDRLKHRRKVRRGVNRQGREKRRRWTEAGVETCDEVAGQNTLGSCGPLLFICSSKAPQVERS